MGKYEGMNEGHTQASPLGEMPVPRTWGLAEVMYEAAEHGRKTL